MEKLWAVRIPVGNEYASLYVSSRNDRSQFPRCLSCGRIQRNQFPPLLVSWESGSTLIGDFVFAYGNLVVREAVAETLLGECSTIQKRLIEFADIPDLYRPAGRSRKKQIWLPYEGPNLCQVVPTHLVDPDPRSTMKTKNHCGTCKHFTYSRFVGVEDERGQRRIPREPGKGFFISRSEISDQLMFRPRYTGLFLVTDEGRGFLESRFTNVTFFEFGEVID